nr:SDR family NAD(P)-dependent oxidoreductase [Actinomycetota bacterium]
TGGGGGLGKAAAKGFAQLGATVTLLVRDTGRAEAARAEIRAAVPGAQVDLMRCDVSDLEDVRRVAAELRGRPLHVLVHNAGVLPPARVESAQHHELTLATHVLGPVLFTELLLPALTGARVIVVSSGGMYTQSLPADDPEYLDGDYKGATAYARTKRIQVALTPLLARRWADRDVGVHAMHPGWADTPGVSTSLPGFTRVLRRALRTPEQGADTVVWLGACDPAPPSGRFWHDRRERPEYFLPFTGHGAEELRRIWRYCAEAVRIDPT